jgi:hypothetical protein
VRVFPAAAHLIRVTPQFILCLFTLCSGLLSAQRSILQVRIIEGEGAVYAAGSRATRGITVQVTDEIGKPVDGAAVNFRLPDDGPGGTFANGSKTEIVTTRPDGRAGVWGMQWNRAAGPFEVRITVVKGPARAGTVCAQSLSASKSADSRARMGSHRGAKWLWISLAAAGAAAGAVFATGIISKAGSAPTATTPGFSIGAPTIILGHS